MKIIFPVLEAEMKRRKITKGQLAKTLGISDKSLYNKLHGLAPFTWNEVSMIRNTYFSDMSSDVLFAKDN